jgi:hypothetical protein
MLPTLLMGSDHDKYSKGLLGKWRNQVDGRGLKEILGNFDL